MVRQVVLPVWHPALLTQDCAPGPFGKDDAASASSFFLGQYLALGRKRTKHPPPRSDILLPCRTRPYTTPCRPSESRLFVRAEMAWTTLKPCCRCAGRTLRVCCRSSA